MHAPFYPPQRHKAGLRPHGRRVGQGLNRRWIFWTIADRHREDTIEERALARFGTVVA